MLRPLLLALVVVIAMAVFVEGGFQFLGWSTLVLPRPQPITEMDALLTAFSTPISLGQTPFSGTPFLLAIPFTTVISVASKRVGDRRLQRISLIAGLLLGAVFTGLQAAFVTAALTGASGSALGDMSFFILGRFKYWLLAVMILQLITATLAWRRNADKAVIALCWIGIINWSLFCAAWLAFLHTILTAG